MRDCALDCGGGHRRGRSHVDARARVAHAAFEVARACGNTNFLGPEHAHVAAAARALKTTQRIIHYKIGKLGIEIQK